MNEFLEYVPFLLEGLRITVWVSMLAFALAVCSAFVLGIARGWGPWPARWAAATVVETLRGTSAVVQLFWAFYVLPQFGVTLSPYVVGIVILGLNEGSYGSEVVRAGFKSIAKGQTEAAMTLGFNNVQTWVRVKLPQAIPVLIPPFGNIAVQQVKFTSLLSLITVHDLTSRAQVVRYNIGSSALIFGAVLIIYYILTLFVSKGFRYLERRTEVGRGGGGAKAKRGRGGGSAGTPVEGLEPVTPGGRA